MNADPIPVDQYIGLSLGEISVADLDWTTPEGDPIDAERLLKSLQAEYGVSTIND